jgi:HlyD family secretion protein
MILLPALILGTAGVGSWYAWQAWQPKPVELRVSGNIEAVQVNISFKIPGMVERRLVDEGDTVRQGREIANLEKADLEADVALRRGELAAAEAALLEMLNGSRKDEIESAKALMEKAKANMDELNAGSRPQEIEAAKADFAAAQWDRDRLRTELERDDRLRATTPGAITPEQYDQAAAAFHIAEEKYLQTLKRYELVKEGPRVEDKDQGKAAYEQAAAQYRLIKEGPRSEEIDQARAKVQQARAALQASMTKLSYATVFSPLNGVCLSKNIEPGEFVAPGTPVVTVADIENIWLRAYVDEQDLGTGRVKWGQEAEITTDAIPGKVYQGRVSFISQEAEFTPKTVQTAKERVKLVYRIKIDVKNPDKELKPGMPADARIKAEGGRGKVEK